MKKIAIITARGGSKRIPGKNIKLFRGKTIIAYSIEVAIRSALFDEVMVSTDSEEIAEISKNFGASIPFMRSKKNSDDFVGTEDVLIEVLNNFHSMHSINFDYACCIYPTAPFITEKRLKEGYELLRNGNYDVVFPVANYDYPLQRSLMFVNEKLQMIFPENEMKRSQDLSPSYHDSGQFYWFCVPSFLKDRKLFGKNTGGIILSGIEVQDIDTEMDWKLAELKHQILFP